MPDRSNQPAVSPILINPKKFLAIVSISEQTADFRGDAGKFPRPIH
jgi:hypothetical protein